ncbi:50S ribosomal protein L25 [Candidatus Peregrinibacteria bacterium CG22_combo_CG10-13_8_21_14_all_44_10]|nr:MAG: hypothetical protein AUK45_00470 [Candidatus Peregrinibacteria bacterium CG2_30_44_17]PIP66481.1 MAG: 50S ribosomal protein L25 [Candidatus Peregrinibacteria bacterium CG22_combo_CG10-13_8_21_14_all_44_10]PIS03914.1 MAG: 50S ribosomal protein L25 [Candidatus Peregrinibacteria bacterium CG10_big_fil_rev_8_21_14_0_10_44_7]PIX79163.1 MAG: 50S ribosomal protein L25 [Candidatus Peregrinibacteria bacterium CG_4_10_14_3_um_filter_44_21]PJB88430.1 MAG: 50S ribosomal protein L25 [Candidatus Pere
MDTYKLKATSRDVAVAAKVVRNEGLIPAILYGHGIDTVSLQMDYQDFRRVYRQAGSNSVIDLDIDGKNHKVLVHRVDVEPVKDTITHIDFINVRMDEEITTMIPVEFTGYAPAVKDLAGTLVHGRTEVEVRCLPGALIHDIQVDLSPLVDFHTSIVVGDIKFPDDITVLDDLELMVVSVSAPREEEPEQEVAPAAGAEGGEAGAPADEGVEAKEGVGSN